MTTPRLLSLSLSRLITTATTTTLRRTTTATPRLNLLRTLSVLPRSLSHPRPRAFSTRQSQNNMNDNNPNWSNRPPKETILLDGCDFEHWLVVVDPPPVEWTRDQIIDSYIETLANVVGSEEEARMKIYSVSTKHYFAFGALVSEELSNKLKDIEKIRWVLPDSYLDVKNKDYGGEPFINGEAVPYDPKYHEEWVRNNNKANERNQRNDRPRNNDRSRNFDRRQGPPPSGNMSGQPNQPRGPPPQIPAGGAPGFQQNPPPRNAGYQQGPPPAGYQQNMSPTGYQQNMPPPNNAGYQQNMPPPNAGYQQNMPPPNAGYQQNMPPPNAGYQQNMPRNGPGFPQNMPPPNNAGGNYGGQGNPGYVNNNTAPNYQAGGQQNFGPNGGMQNQNVPGRD